MHEYTVHITVGPDESDDVTTTRQQSGYDLPSLLWSALHQEDDGRGVQTTDGVVEMLDIALENDHGHGNARDEAMIAALRSAVDDYKRVRADPFKVRIVPYPKKPKTELPD